MKDKLAITIALALLTSGPIALAQDSGTSQSDKPASAQTDQPKQSAQGAATADTQKPSEKSARSGESTAEQGGGTNGKTTMGQADQSTTGTQNKDQVKADMLKGVAVKDTQDKTVGKVESVILGQEGKVKAIVLKTSEPSGSSARTDVNEQGADQHLAASLIGLNVKNDQDEDIGEIDNLLVDSDGHIEAAVIGVGGFLGLGEKLVGVAWSKVTVMPNNMGARVSMSREQLESAPAFKTQEEIRQQKEQSMSSQSGESTTTQ